MKLTHLIRLGLGAFVMSFMAITLVPGAAQDTLKFTDAAQYYKDGKCVVCHGQKAEKKFDTSLTDEQLVDIIMKGKKPEKPPNMPAYADKGLTAEQAKSLVDHMKQLKSAQ